MNSQGVLTLREVSVPSRRDAETAVLDNVTMDVHAGEFWIIGGLQGSGKSDLMFMLDGLTKPLRGRYELFGQDMGLTFGDEFLPNRLRTGMVFDDARLLNELTVAENVALPIRYHQNLSAEESATWISALMKETEIEALAAQRPSVVTRSWRLRVALARALALRPELLLIENVLRGLDARHSIWWAKFLQQLWRGHSLMGGRPMTIVASADELRLWREGGLNFAEVRAKQFVVSGTTVPAEHEWPAHAEDY
jgi:putative ABC transport system ATP-binding protein